MANLTQTRSSVGIKSQTSKTRIVQYNEAMSPGTPCYQHSNKKYAKASTVDAETSNVSGITLTDGGADDWGVIALPESDVDVGATLGVAEQYEISDTAGSIAEAGDVTASGKFKATLGYAKAADTLYFDPQIAGVAIP